MSKFTLGNLDLFYISYDELNSGVNWSRVLSMNPDAKRIHGVKGFDRVHKACAMASTTDRFITIDGDNWINDGIMGYELDDTDIEDVCFSFKSRNFINGLEYGNGGIKVWKKSILLESKTHEIAESTDFCWDIRYYQVNYSASTTVQNCTPHQAWRAGYREGIKMSQIDGRSCKDLRHNWKNIFKGNLNRLHIWCSIGRDVDNGVWAIAGSRLALLDQLRNDIPHTVINDYDWFKERWEGLMHSDPEILSIEYGKELIENGFYFPELDREQSAWFKNVYINPPREGLMR